MSDGLEDMWDTSRGRKILIDEDKDTAAAPAVSEDPDPCTIVSVGR